MQILIALILGAVIGIAAHVQVRDRATRGAAVIPMLGTVVAGAAWLALTWAGLGADTPWPWLSAVVVPTIVCWPAAILLAKARVSKDEREKAALGIG
ncbi:hypothetical protein [Microbacterium xanthum]|uniref:hypothetical protein n=1 Tax=Microbacterium xanthum TaxID=3079794 RepID=UPI002AD1F562|nr:MULTISPECIES: hypothetical protein [unclassified Microbacterium]MDZ8172159.1 hypothetical protein [Microbacterium sp. KSW-48]MDZ8202134.1 hypothetical protein [Microbacterium sp. SSW1-59]